MDKINVSIIGVGSFAKALVEGVSFYTVNPEEPRGLLNPLVGGYHVKDINFVAAFDVDGQKVGRKLHEAISAGPNVTHKIVDPLEYPAVVHRGPTLDGLTEEIKGVHVQESDVPAAEVADILRETQTDVVINLVPTGSQQATELYAQAALDAGCSFVNCIPTPLAVLPEWQERFQEKGLALIGDDIKSQLGATMLNRLLLSLLKSRGITVLKSEQENRGGNLDHLNLQYRADSKEKSKREALRQFLQEGDAEPHVSFVYTGEPSGHKRVTIEIEGEIFGRTPISITSVIEDEISINGAGVAVDAIRAAKALADKGEASKAGAISAFLMKSPGHHMDDSQAATEFRNLLT